MSGVKRVERLLANRNVRGLCRALRHRDSLVRRRAAQALGVLGNPAAVPFLLRALYEDPDQYVQRWAIESLQQIGDEAAVAALVEIAFSMRTQLASLAVHALTAANSLRAAAALGIRDAIARGDFEALAAVDDNARASFAAVLRSEQFAAWPASKRRRLLAVAAQTDVNLPASKSAELARMGLYVSGVHTIGDLLAGLNSRSPDVRIAAAAKLASSGQRWSAFLLYRRFRRETRADGDAAVAAALARELERLGDSRPVQYYVAQLTADDTHIAAEAAERLAAIGTQQALETLFLFAAEAGPGQAERRIPLALTAIAGAGPAAADILRSNLTNESPAVRRLMVDVIASSRHLDTITLLANLCRDGVQEVQRAALAALAALNSAEAATALYGLVGDVPDELLARTLAAITHPLGPEYLRRVQPGATTLAGVLLDGDRQPVPAAYVQVMREYDADEETILRPASVRTRTDADGSFALSLLDMAAESSLQIKVVLPAEGRDRNSRTLSAGLPLVNGQANVARARIDRIFSRLVVEVTAPE